MKNLFKFLALILSAMIILSFAGCSSDSDSATKLQTENVDDVDPAAEKPENDSNENTDTDDDELEKAIEEINSKNSAATVINETGVGDTINYSDMSSLDNDPTGLHITEDYDGDGIPNASEIVTNPYVADYPRIVTRISPPIIMELQPTTTTEVD
ncbi:MAG TPA: hypothetical protein P5123_01580, partial [Spirochaetota bacterium]|nr:hypothetical protein [Spirochaetota bacterium]